VERTRRHVLAVARELLPEVGPAGLTYSLLAERAGVTRQTLYRHWPARAGWSATP
jgi:AcrR family transcriptional regulator